MTGIGALVEGMLWMGLGAALVVVGWVWTMRLAKPAPTIEVLITANTTNAEAALRRCDEQLKALR